MGWKSLSAAIARCAPHEPMRASFRVLLALALVLLAAGCAASASGTASDKDAHRGFYGGISVGGAVP